MEGEASPDYFDPVWQLCTDVRHGLMLSLAILNLFCTFCSDANQYSCFTLLKVMLCRDVDVVVVGFDNILPTLPKYKICNKRRVA